jgi:hypothetical protein
MKSDAYLDLGFVACEPLPLPYFQSALFSFPWTLYMWCNKSNFRTCWLNKDIWLMLTKDAQQTDFNLFYLICQPIILL